MAISERDRARLAAKLRGALGEEGDILMAQLPRHKAEELATKSFVRDELGSLRREMHAGFEGIRAEMAALRTEMVAGFAQERAGRHAMGEGLRAEFRGELVAAITTQTRMVLFALVGTMLSIAALAVTLARFQG
ncbi:hypothetical protein BH23ACT7_BH23ACT7_09670 [soil metagenome]